MALPGNVGIDFRFVGSIEMVSLRNDKAQPGRRAAYVGSFHRRATLLQLMECLDPADGGKHSVLVRSIWGRSTVRQFRMYRMRNGLNQSE